MNGKEPPIGRERNIPTFQEGAGKVAASEIKRLTGDWQNGVNLVWRQNRALVDKDFANAQEIVKETGSSFEGKDPKSQEVQDEVSRRQQEQQRAQTTNIDDIVQQLVSQDGAWKDKDPKSDEVQNAATQEAKRREGLVKAFEQLYKAEDEMVAITTAADRAADHLFEEEKKNKLQALTEAARLKDLQAPEVTTLPGGEAEETKLKEDIRAKIIPEYYDKDNGVYYRIGLDGKPDKSNPVVTPEAYQPVFEEIRRISSGVKEAQTLLETLVYNPEQKAFRVLTDEEIKTNEIKQDERVIVGGVEDWLAEVPEEIITANPEVFKKDNAGKIVGVDRKKLDEILKDLPANSEAGHRLILLAAYYDEKIPAEQKENIVALMYHGLQKSNPDLLKGLKHVKEFEARLDNIKIALIQQYRIPAEIATGIDFDHIFRDLGLASVCEDKLTEQGLPPDAQKVLADWKTTPVGKELITRFASGQGSVSSFLANTFGIDAKILTDQGQRQQYIQRGIDKIFEKRGLNIPDKAHEREVYQAVYNHEISNEMLEKIAAKHGLSGVSGTVIMLLLILGPAVFGGLGFGGPSGRDQQQE